METNKKENMTPLEKGILITILESQLKIAEAKRKEIADNYDATNMWKFRVVIHAEIKEINRQLKDLKK